MVIDKVKFFILCAQRCKRMPTVVRDAGLSPSVMRYIDAGKPSTAETVGKLAKVLQCQPNELLKLQSVYLYTAFTVRLEQRKTQQV